MKFVKQQVTLVEARRNDRLNSESEKSKALLEYIAMMADVEIPRETNEEMGGMTNEQDV